MINKNLKKLIETLKKNEDSEIEMEKIKEGTLLYDGDLKKYGEVVKLITDGEFVLGIEVYYPQANDINGTLERIQGEDWEDAFFSRFEIIGKIGIGEILNFLDAVSDKKNEDDDVIHAINSRGYFLKIKNGKIIKDYSFIELHKPISKQDNDVLEWLNLALENKLKE